MMAPDRISRMMQSRAGIIVFAILLAGVKVDLLQAQNTPPLFETVVFEGIDPLRFGAAAWADFDADGDFDLFYAGGLQVLDVTTPFSQLYFNNGIVQKEVPDPSGSGTILVPVLEYEEALGVTSPVMLDMWRGAIAWGDYDGDGDVDPLTTGKTSIGENRIRLYENVGGLERISVRFEWPGVSNGDIAWGDYDNDGDLDFIVSGTANDGEPTTELYENRVRSEGGFVLRSTDIIAVSSTSLEWGDFDNDQDLDLLITGIGSPQSFETRLYRNEGNGVFADTGIDFGDRFFSSVNFADADADGDLDIMLTGARISPFVLEGSMTLYENLGSENFDADGFRIEGRFENDPAYGRYQGQTAFGDFNNDGMTDFFVTGRRRPLDTRSGQVYENQGNHTFAKSNIGGKAGRFDGGGFGEAFWGDFDDDGDLDMFVLGKSPSNGDVVFGLRNYRALYPVNTDPEPPATLDAQVSGRTVHFSWSPGSDNQTPTSALTYNIRVGTTPGAGDILSPMSTATGHRLLSASGNAGSNAGWQLIDIPAGTYYWSVQSIDTSYRGSLFSAEGTFTVTF